MLNQVKYIIAILLCSGLAAYAQKAKVKDPKTQEEAKAYQAAIKDLDTRQSAIYKQYDQADTAEKNKLELEMNELEKQKTERANAYIAAHPKSAFSVSLVQDRAFMGAYAEVMSGYEKLDETAKQTAEGKRIGERLVVLKRSAIGTQMLDFTQNDTKGKPVKFADFKGKYVLIDFWASWCHPCRAENPNVLKAYNQYKDKNFTVIGISLDDKSDKWEKAIQEDHMPWTQVSDLKGFKNEVSTYYGVNGIPSTLLIDPQGKIIAKDLRGESLNKKLAELFN